MVGEPHVCPVCNANLISSEIPADKRCNDSCPTRGLCPDHAYGKNSRYFYRTVGFYAHDMTLFYYCPDCKAAWHRFKPNNIRYPVAAKYMRAYKYADVTHLLKEHT